MFRIRNANEDDQRRVRKHGWDGCIEVVEVSRMARWPMIGTLLFWLQFWKTRRALRAIFTEEEEDDE